MSKEKMNLTIQGTSKERLEEISMELFGEVNYSMTVQHLVVRYENLFTASAMSEFLEDIAKHSVAKYQSLSANIMCDTSGIAEEYRQLAMAIIAIRRELNENEAA